MPKAAAKLPELSAWKAEMLRLTVFHKLGPQSDDQGWWQTVAGAAPESKNSKPREGGYEVSGPMGPGVLTLRGDPFRFDWLYTAPISLDTPLVGIPTVGPLTEALTVFLPLMQSWLPLAPPTHRVAFGTVAMQPVDDRVAGYRLLDKYLPSITMDPENSSEFSYSINRHRKVEGFGNLHINRLSKWSVLRFQPFAINVNAIAGQHGTANSVQGAAHEALRLELDMNTDAQRTQPYDANQLPALFAYLVDLGKEILENGDIK